MQPNFEELSKSNDSNVIRKLVKNQSVPESILIQLFNKLNNPEYSFDNEGFKPSFILIEIFGHKNASDDLRLRIANCNIEEARTEAQGYLALTSTFLPKNPDGAQSSLTPPSIPHIQKDTCVITEEIRIAVAQEFIDADGAISAKSLAKKHNLPYRTLFQILRTPTKAHELLPKELAEKCLKVIMKTVRAQKSFKELMAIINANSQKPLTNNDLPKLLTKLLNDKPIKEHEFAFLEIAYNAGNLHTLPNFDAEAFFIKRTAYSRKLNEASNAQPIR